MSALLEVKRARPVLPPLLIALAFMLKSVGACAGEASAPEWVNRGSGPFIVGGQRTFVGVGVVQGIRDRSFAAAAANLRACGEIGKTFNSYVTRLVSDFAPEQGKAKPGESESYTFKAFAKPTLHGARILGRWRDPSDGTEFSRCELGLEAMRASLELSDPLPEAALTKAFDALAPEKDRHEAEPASPVASHAEAVTAVALSPDGRRALSGDSRVIALWELASGRRLWARPASAALVAFSADGRTVAAAGADGLIHSWDADTGGARPSPGNEIRMIILTKDYAAAVGEHQENLVSQTAKNTVESSLAGVELSARCAGKDYMASSSEKGKAQEDQAVSLDGGAGLAGPATRAQRRWTARSEIEGDMKSGVESVLWTDEFVSADGKRGLSAGTDGKVSFYDPADKDSARAAAVEGLRASALSADGSAALTGSGAAKDNLTLWDAAAGRTLGSWTLPSAVTAIAFSPDGRTALLGLGSDRGNLKLLHLAPNKQGRPVFDKAARIVDLSPATPP